MDGKGMMQMPDASEGETSMVDKIKTAITSTTAGATLTADQVTEIANAVDQAVSGGNAEQDDLDAMESMTQKQPHPLGKEFEG